MILHKLRINVKISVLFLFKLLLVLKLPKSTYESLALLEKIKMLTPADVNPGGVGTCPVAESLHSESLVSIPICAYDWQSEDVESVIRAFHKVWEALPL